MLFPVPGDPVTYRLWDKVIRRGVRRDGAFLLDDFSHDLLFELLGVSRCWHGIYPIDSREEKLPLSEKDHALQFWPRFLLRSFLILPIRRVKSVNVGGFALWPCVSGSGWGFSGLGLVRRRR